MKVIAIVQARMASTRLPGKVLMEVLGKPLLYYLIERLRKSKWLDNIVIATSSNPLDTQIIDFCEKYQTPYFIGSEDDVLARYYHASLEYKADAIVRITSDCPVIDPLVVDKAIKLFINNSHDYVSNTITRSYPRGMDTEVFSFSALEEAFTEAVQPPYREHVTPFIYNQSHRYNLFNFKIDTNENQSHHRWTVDTIEDFELIQTIISKLYPNSNDFSLLQILQLFDSYPEMFDINSHIEQKNVVCNYFWHEREE